MPVWSDVRVESPRSILCEPHESLGPLLSRTECPGHGFVHICSGSVLRSHSALLELHIMRLDSIGGIQLGVAAVTAKGSTACSSPHLHDQLWFDGCGRVSIGPGITRPAVPLPQPVYSERLRSGDRVGILYDASICCVALVARKGHASTMQDDTLSLLGPPVPLRFPAYGANDSEARLPNGNRLLGYQFVLRFDWAPGLAVRIDATRRVAVHAGVLSCKPIQVRRLLESHKPVVVVRTLGADARNIGISLDPSTATVADLRRALAEVLGCEADHTVEVRASPLGGWGSSGEILSRDAAKLVDCGIELDPATGVHGCWLYAHVPHLIS